MLKKIKDLSIGWKLPGMIVGAGGLVGVCIGVSAFLNASATLESEARVRLGALVESRKASLQDYLSSIEEDLRFVASNPNTKQALLDFNAGWKALGDNPELALQELYITENPHPTGTKEELDYASDGSTYSDVHRQYHPWFREFLRERGYYDIFLFNLEGDLIYTVFKELDYATNLVSGKYRDTDLGNAFRAARDNGTASFQEFFDFKPYAPSHGAPASFISKPLVDEQGRSIGVLVFQMPIDRLNHVVQQTAGLGESGQSFLVGPDNLMRSDLRLAEESTILAREVDNSAVQAALAGEHGTADVLGTSDERAIAAYTPIDFNGTRWAMLAEMARHEILAPAEDLAWRLLAISLMALVGLAAIGWYLAKGVAGPLVEMVSTVELMAKGVQTDIPSINRGDEIGSVARSLEEVRQKGLEATRLRSALDNCSTMVLVSNRRGQIVYVNPGLCEYFRTHESEVRKSMPNFEASEVFGSNVDAFLKNHVQDYSVIENLTSPKTIELNFGSRRLRVVVSPVTNEAKDLLGTVVEWADQTDEIVVQEAFNRVISAARQGDFSQTIPLSNVEGVNRQLASGMNELTEAVTTATDELGNMLAAMADGDLERRIEADFQGQFGALKEHANNTAAQLATIVGKVKAAAGEVSTAAAEITSGTEDLSSRTEKAASNLEETAASTEEMSATVKQNADSAKKASELAGSANQVANKGGEVVNRAVTAMSGIEDSARKITDIISVIDEIAFQTNLLALNASVEAARAGEAGKGFAVVAQEVRQLAQRSAQAAADIKTLIQDSNGQVKDGVQLVNQAGEALAEIVGSIGKVAGIVEEISGASQEQASGVQEINRSITSLDEMTQQNSALVEQSTAAARAMTDQSGQLAELMAFFKLNTGSAVLPSKPIPARKNFAVKSTPAVAATCDEGWDEF